MSPIALTQSKESCHDAKCEGRYVGDVLRLEKVITARRWPPCVCRLVHGMRQPGGNELAPESESVQTLLMI